MNIRKDGPVFAARLQRGKNGTKERMIKTSQNPPTQVGVFCDVCARTWDRTKDLTSISRVLYQLSYTRLPRRSLVRRRAVFSPIDYQKI